MQTFQGTSTKKTAVVTGGAGFLGSHFISQALNQEELTVFGDGKFASPILLVVLRL
jgi:nucleoside-diphosphate-sugar epimerase